MNWDIVIAAVLWFGPLIYLIWYAMRQDRRGF